MTRLLITGGAGFIGSNFVYHWLRKYTEDRVIVLDALTYAGNLQNLELVRGRDGFRFIRGNICDFQLVADLLREEKIDTIVHFAAESHVDRSISTPDVFIETNIVGTHSLLKAARQIWINERQLDQHRFHHVSTDEVYGSLAFRDPPSSEFTSYAPNSPYSASKAASDYLVRAYHRTYGLKVTTSNCSNNYGPYHFPEKLIPLVIVNLLEGRPLPIYGDGRNVRDWLYVTDHCAAIELILKHGRAGEVYNIGGETEIENISIVRNLCVLVDQVFATQPLLKIRFPNSPQAHNLPGDSLITYVSDRPGHDQRYAINCSKIKHELGYVASMTIESGLRATVEWYLNNEQWWRSVINGTYRQWMAAQHAL